MTFEEDRSSASEDTAQRALTADITEDIVRLYKELFGRGPTRARTELAGPDTIICSLWDTLTPAERGLLEVGHDDRARETRILFQYSRTDVFVGIVEQRTGRKVLGFVSGIDVRADIASEVFYLEPRGHDGSGANRG